MKCSHCGHTNPERARFCLECGTPVTRGCASCGTELPSGAKFCLECGIAVAGATPKASTAAAPERDMLSYTPKHLADKILQSRSALEGERKQVTVLFADVKGSMELAAQLDPEEWHSILERFFAILTEGVHRFEGTVNQYTGDGIMALFGAPIAHEDHAQRACYAALHMRDALREFSREIRRAHGLDFSTRMGLNSGDVIVGRIGDDLRMDYTAQGHTVGLAQRMESLAEPNACFMTDATAALVAGYFALDNLGEFTLKGSSEPVRVHSLIGAGLARSRFDISRARGLSRFVGRAADIRTLEDALAQGASGTGQVIGVVADAGTGKSRLCFEFLESCRARGMQVYEARAVAHGRNIALLPILELFRAYFGITTQDDDRTTREKIAGRMVLLDTAFADSLPLLFDFLGVADPQRPVGTLDPEVRQRQLLAVLRQVIQSVSVTQPVVTLIEDLHWLDAASGEFLANMVEAQAESKNLLLLNFRPEYHAPWMQKSWYRQIPLTPLGRAEIGDLLTSVLGGDASIAALAAPVHQRTGGNPFFAEEIAQTLIESGHLEGTRGNYRLLKPIESLAVPATVQALLAARIDRLAEREKGLLQTAAVIGKDFSEPLLTAVAGVSAEDLKAAITELRRAEFLHELSIYPVAEYTFKHPLTQEVALGSQLKERRRTVHAAVARAIELQDAARLDERSPLLAQHWEEAGEALIAARWHLRAVNWLRRTDINATAQQADHLRRVVRGLPVNPEVAELGITACKELINQAWRIGTPEAEVRALLKEGASFADAGGDARAGLTLSIIFSRALCGLGDVAGYVDLARANLHRAKNLSDVYLEANAWGYLADALRIAGYFKEVIELAGEGHARYPTDIPEALWLIGLSPRAMTRFQEAIALWVTGQTLASLRVYEQLRQLEEESLPEVRNYIEAEKSELYVFLNDPESTLACAQAAAESQRQLGDSAVLVTSTNRAFTNAHLAGGRYAEAVESARAYLDAANRGPKDHSAQAAAFLAEALLANGEFDIALSTADQAIELSRRTPRMLHEILAQGVKARALLRRDGAAARTVVEAAFTRASELIEITGALTYGALLREWRAELAAVLGDEVRRVQLLNEARGLFDRCAAPLQVKRINALLEAVKA